MRLSPPRAPVARVRPCTDPDAVLNTILFDPIDATGTGWQIDVGLDGLWSVESAYGFRDPADLDGSEPTWHLYGYDAPVAGWDRVARAGATTIPGGGRPVFLWFRHAYGFDDGSQDLDPNDERYDGGVVEVKVGSGPWTDIGPLLLDHGYDGTLATAYQNPIQGRRAFTAESNGYGASRAVLTGFPALDLAGRSVKVAFRIASDNAYGGDGWFIDDVRIYRCADTGDDSPPVVSAPAVVLRRGTVGATGGIRSRVTFEAGDPSGVALTMLEHAVGGATPASILPSAAARRADVVLPSVSALQHLTAGARDEQGNTSDGATTDVRMRLVQESGASFGGAWSRRTSSGFSGGAVRAARASGSTASLTIAGARSVGFVTTKGPDRGFARVCVDGTGCRVLDLYRATTKTRQVVAAWSFPGAASRTISVKVLGQRRTASSGTRVDVDGFVAVTD